MIDRIGEKIEQFKNKVLKDLKLVKYWRLIVLDEGPMLQDFKIKPGKYYFHKGIRFTLPGDNLGRIAPALKLVTNLVQAGSAVVGFPVKLEKVFQCLENINIGDLGAMYDNFKLEDDAVKNANIYKSDANSVQKELSTLVDDEISRKHLLNSREHLKNAIEQICPSWQKQLIDDGLYRIYNLSEGLGYYVSKFYFDQVREGKVAGYKIKD